VRGLELRVRGEGCRVRGLGLRSRGLGYKLTGLRIYGMIKSFGLSKGWSWGLWGGGLKSGFYLSRAPVFSSD